MADTPKFTSNNAGSVRDRLQKNAMGKDHVGRGCGLRSLPVSGHEVVDAINPTLAASRGPIGAVDRTIFSEHAAASERL